MTDPEQSEPVPVPSADPQISPLKQAATVAVAYLTNTHQTQKNQAYQVFHALAERALEREAVGRSCELAAAALKDMISPASGKGPSAWLSPLWQQLEEDEQTWQHGLRETAHGLGLGYIPKLVKRPGSPAVQYLIEAIQIPEDSLAESAVVPAGGISYTSAAVAAPAAWLSSTLQGGVVRWSTSLRWTVGGAAMGLLVVLMLVIWMTLAVGSKIQRPLSPADLAVALTLCAFAFVVAEVFRFLVELFDLGIIMAPALLTPLKDGNVTLELRRSMDDAPAHLAFVRYSGTCTRCGGSVVLFDGRPSFPGRIVGRCRRSPREHVFSFDPATRAGASLR